MKRARQQGQKRGRQKEFEDVASDAAIPSPPAVDPTPSHRQHDAESQHKRPRIEPEPAPLSAAPNEQVLKRVYTKPQGASAFMDAFKPRYSSILQAMLASESPPFIGQPCSCGMADAFCLCHCNDCDFFEPCCASCFIKAHQRTPYHWVELWNGRFFERKDISQLGHIITFGHDSHGNCCPHAKTIEFTIVTVNGVHQTRVAFCECIGKTQDRFDHLLHARIFPATISAPQIGFTFSLLKDFHLQTLTSKKSPYDYIYAIRQKTSNAFVDSVPNPYSQFLRVQRIWRALTLIKNSGQGHGIDRFFPLRRPGSVMVPCFACPEPGFNMPDEQWGTLDQDLQFLNTLFIMKDGHFGLQRLAKTITEDPDDVSLLDGAGLFPPDEIYNDYVRNVVAYSEEKTTCSKFNAVEMQNKIKFKGAIITGVLAVECMRHVIFLSMVDLQMGERYANADFCLAYFLRHFLIFQWMQRAKYFLRIVETYDVACQYYVHLKKRFESNFPDLADVIDIMYLLVPKKHLDGHKEDCKYRFSLNYSEGVGRSHGEGIEASWAESKQSGGSTRQMNHGHRHDTINDLHNYWNWNKFRGLGLALSDGLRKAYKKRESMVDHFIGLSILRGKDSVKDWEGEKTEAWFDKGEWHSVYRLQQSKLPTQTAIFQSIEASEKAQKAVDDAFSANSTSLPRLMHLGIKIQEKQRDLRHAIKYPDGSDGSNIPSQRQSLAQEIASWRKTQLRALPQLEPLLSSIDPTVNAEDDILFLPSDFNQSDHATWDITSLASIEYQLREGQANDAVTSLCNAILHTMVLRDAKTAQARGVYQNTRALKFINSVKSRKATWVARYQEARLRLLALKNSDAQTLEDFPELADEDTYAKNASSARNLGDGTKTNSWIWTFGRLRGLSKDEQADFVVETKKVQWFRARADMMRWVEEVELLEEEFRRLIRGLEKMESVWESLALTPTSALKHPPSASLDGVDPGYSAYASRKAAMFRKMAGNERQRFEDAGGRWPLANESLSDHVRQRRPELSANWLEVEKELAEAST